MAPALTSNSFRLASGGLYSKPENRCRRLAVISAQAKQSPFSFPRTKDESSEDEAQGDGSAARPNPFSIDFGKIPDVKSLIPVVRSPSTSLFASTRRKDPQTVFVAGATGQAGVRIAHTLLRQGFSVRAGVPDLSSAQELARIAASYKFISPEEFKRLNAVEATFEDAESIAKAIGPAAKVVVTIGSQEKGPSGEVTTDEALEVVRAAQLAGVAHVAIIYNSGPGLSGTSTYNVLDGITSFFNNLFARSQQLTLGEFLSNVVETDVRYTIIKTNLTEDYSDESLYGLVVGKEGSTVVGTTDEFKVSKSQIAKLVADVFANTSIAENKVVEVSTSPSAVSKPVEELFSAIPEDQRRQAYAEALERAKAEEEARLAAEKAEEATKATNRLEKQAKRPSEARAASLTEDPEEKAEATIPTLDDFLSKAKGLSAEFSWDKFSSQITAAVDKNTEENPLTQLATIRGQAKARKLPPQKAIVKQPVVPKMKPRRSTPEPKPKPNTEVNKIFGGLFKQETIYIDDD